MTAFLVLFHIVVFHNLGVLGAEAPAGAQFAQFHFAEAPVWTHFAQFQFAEAPVVAHFDQFHLQFAAGSMDELLELRARLSLSKDHFGIPMGSAVGYIDVTAIAFQVFIFS